MPATTSVPHPEALTLCDAHVHIYDCFDIDTLLYAAWENFRRAATQAGAVNYSGVLMLSETANDHSFARLAQAAAGAETRVGDWTFSRTAETESIRAHSEHAGTLFILAGRQIVSREKLEILTLASNYQQADGAPAEDIIAAAGAAGSLVVAPWGVGKWWGKRGRLLSELLQKFPADALALGDNSGRPWFMGTPRHFRTASSQQRRLLPGSDPLPFAREAWRPGSVGFSIPHTLDGEHPAADIKRQLRTASILQPYMHCERLLPFVRNQLGMQLRKRFS